MCNPAPARVRRQRRKGPTLSAMRRLGSSGHRGLPAASSDFGGALRVRKTEKVGKAEICSALGYLTRGELQTSAEQQQWYSQVRHERKKNLLRLSRATIRRA